MKGFVKVMIAGAVILGIGLIMLIAVLGLNGWTFKPEWEMKNFECAQENETLKIDQSAGFIKINYYDGDVIKVEYPECKNFTTEVTEENGTLKLTSGKRHWYNVLAFVWDIPDTVISVPRGARMNIDAYINAGGINIPDGDYGTIKIYLNAGSAEAGAVKCGTLDCKLNAGALNVKSAECDVLKTELNAGSAKLGTVTCGDVFVKLNAGYTEMDIYGTKSEYNIAVEKNAGECSVEGQTGTTPKKLVCKINAGSCMIGFKN